MIRLLRRLRRLLPAEAAPSPGGPDSDLGWRTVEGQRHFFLYPAVQIGKKVVAGRDSQPVCELSELPPERPVRGSRPTCAACDAYVAEVYLPQIS
jgi:hypothetical protein